MASRGLRDARGRRVRRDRHGDGAEGGHHVGPSVHARNEGEHARALRVLHCIAAAVAVAAAAAVGYGIYNRQFEAIAIIGDSYYRC